MKPKFVINSEVDIYCQECKEAGRGAVKLIVKENRITHHQFLGCSQYPECVHTQEIPESMIMRAQGQQELF